MTGMGNVMNGFVMFWYREVTSGLGIMLECIVS